MELLFDATNHLYALLHQPYQMYLPSITSLLCQDEIHEDDCEYGPRLYEVGIENQVGSGSFGRYYQINDTLGIKVLRRKTDDGTPLHLEDLENEFNLLLRLHKDCPGIFPEPYEIVTTRRTSTKNNWSEEVKRKTFILPGILMEHIKGTNASNIEWTDKMGRQMDLMKAKLAKKGWEWTDDHTGNVMLTPDKTLRFLDAGPKFTHNFKKAA